MPSDDYRLPPASARESAKVGAFKERLQDGRTFLKQQRGYMDISRSIDVIAGIADKPVPDSLSNLSVNFIKRQAREMVATLSNLKPLWGYTTKNETYDIQSYILNHIVFHWWHSTFADRDIRQALQWALCGQGYLSPIWKPDFWPDGTGDIQLYSYGPMSVIPVQLPADGDLQEAYAVIIHLEVPLAQAHRMYPQYADWIKADRSQSSLFSRRMRSASARFLSPVTNMLNKDREKEDTVASGPVCDIYNCYVLDQSINSTLQTIQMGKPGTSWHYEVPYLGQLMEDGRKATPDNCKLYPLRRLMTFTNNHCLQDDTSPWWHGKVPIVKLAIDDWPWEFLGYSVIRDVQSISDSINRALRGADDWIQKMVRPDVEYDETRVSEAYMNRYDPRMPGNKVPKRYGQEAIRYIPGPDINLPGVGGHVQMLREMLDHMLAIRDMQNLAKAAQIPASETIDKILEMAGPLVTDISRGLERCLRDVGEMVKALIFQFYSVQKRVKILGTNGFLPEDFIPLKRQEVIIEAMTASNQLELGEKASFFTFNPDQLVPTKLAQPARSLTRLLPTNLRAALAAKDGCVFHITPGSLHQITQMQEKLMYVQLWRDQRFPIDPQTIAERTGVDNFGTLPGDPVTVLERWQSWNKLQLANQMAAQQMMAQQQMEMQAQAAQAQAAAQAQGQAQGIVQGVTGGGPPQGNLSVLAGGKGKEGRPPSGEKAPHLELKDGGTRSTIAES